MGEGAESDGAALESQQSFQVAVGGAHFLTEQPRTRDENFAGFRQPDATRQAGQYRLPDLLFQFGDALRRGGGRDVGAFGAGERSGLVDVEEQEQGHHVERVAHRYLQQAFNPAKPRRRNTTLS